MQFGGTPMVPSPSSAGDSSSSLQVSSSLDGLSNFINGDIPKRNLSNRPNSMFAPHPNIVTQHGLLQNNSNGQMSNGSAANGSSHYISNNQQQQQQQQQQQVQILQQQQQQSMANGNNANGHTAVNGSSSNTTQLIYPALHLQPLNDTFAPKQISLSPPGPQNKIKIGRQTNQKTIPQPSNGYFDSKVLSRMHAEVWSQDGKVFIKDVKSSNGTFINGSRLSPEGQESDIFELHTDDIVEFGIDIVGEDNKTTLHHKVACRAFLVMTAEEALGLRHDFAALYRGGIAGSTLTHHSVGPGAEGGLRRSKVGPGGGNGYGGAGNGGAMMSFDHILHKLQAELQKSRDTAGELGNLNTAMHDIGETLGGGLPPMQNPPYQHMVPSLNGDRDAQKQGAEQGQGDAAKASSDSLVKVLEEQVQETQRALNTHVERLAGLEARLEEHAGVKLDVNLMRSQVEEARKELAEALRMRSLAGQGGLIRNGRGVDISKAHRDFNEADDFDDGASMASVDTVVQGEGGAKLGNAPMGVDEVESAEVAGRFSHHDDDMLDDAETLQRLKNHIGPRAPPDGVTAPFGREAESDEVTNQRNEELSKRLQTIESQLERALELGKVLAGQHAEASEAVKRLEEKVKSLEGDKETREEAPIHASHNEGSEDVLMGAGVGALGAAGASGSILAILEAKWGKWRDAFESDFEVERAGFRQEREDIKRVVKMWDGLNSDVEDALDADVSEESKSDAVREDVQASPPTGSRQLTTTAKKRSKKRRAANAAAAMAASSSPSTSSVGLSTSVSSRSVQDSTARINRELRSLLYTDKFNSLVREEHFNGDDALGTPTDREETPTQSDVGTGRLNEDGEIDGRSRVRSHLLAEAKRRPPGSGNGRSASGARAGLDGPTALPMLGVAGVMVLGMTAWVLSGGKTFHLSGAPGTF